MSRLHSEVGPKPGRCHQRTGFWHPGTMPKPVTHPECSPRTAEALPCTPISIAAHPAIDGDGFGLPDAQRTGAVRFGLQQPSKSGAVDEDPPDRISPTGVNQLGRSRTAPKGTGLKSMERAGSVRGISTTEHEKHLERSRSRTGGGRRRSLRDAARAMSLSIKRIGSNSSASGAEPMLCSLGDLSETYMSRVPKFHLTPYTADAPHSASNALALVHNAAQKELSVLIAQVIPACLRAARGEVKDEKRLEDVMCALDRWWGGFHDVSTYVARAETIISEAIFARFMRCEDVMYDQREVKAADRQRAKIYERTTLTVQLVFKAVQETITEGVDNATPGRFTRVVQAMNIVVNFLLETYAAAYSFVRFAEGKVKKKKVSGIVKQAVKLVDKCKDVPLCTLILVRWMEDPIVIDNWIRKNLSRKTRKNFLNWQADDAQDRSAALETIIEKTS